MNTSVVDGQQIEELAHALIRYGSAALLFFLGMSILLFAIWKMLLCWWYPDPAVRQVFTKRKRIADDFGVTISRIKRNGVMRIAPKDSESWNRTYIEDELGQFLKMRMSVKPIGDGLVKFGTKIRVPEIVKGRPSFDGKHLTIGIDVQTGEKARVKLSENSCVVIAGGPGSGKTVLANGVLDAIKRSSPNARVTLFDGKGRASEDERSLTERLDDDLKEVEATMNERLKKPGNRWHKTDPELVVYAIDEVHVLVNGTGEKKPVIEERIARMRKIVSLGREAAVMLVLMTQRPTADAIPSQIRSLAGVSMCGKVANRAAIEAGLGRLPEDGEPDPLKISKAGRFVVDDSTGPWREVQTFAPA